MPGTAGRQSTERATTMTTDDHALVPVQHNPMSAMPHDTHGGISNPVLGMILFITSEVMFFGGLFAAYFNIRANAAQWPPEQFHDTLKILPFVGPATVLLIISSFTCQMAIWSIRRDDRAGFVRAIGITLVLGIAFLIGQVYDYSTLGFGISDTPFGTTFYTLTGFHGAHVFGGAVMLSVILYRGLAGQFSSRHHDAVEAVSLYWHFVDVVWIVLFSTLYLL
jgi:cytochrome c oxidase subunit 3